VIEREILREPRESVEEIMMIRRQVRQAGAPTE
jgi:hypothetical protein